MFNDLQPVVLVGGESRRFGRDKLQEPIGRHGGPDQLLVDHSIRVLREVFGSRVALVGSCAAEVQSRGDLTLRDDYPGIGPMGGVISALERTESSIMVLPGDLTTITKDVVYRLVDEASKRTSAVAVLAHSRETQWCIGVYRYEVLPLLKSKCTTSEFALKRALPHDRVFKVDIDEHLLRNANHPADLDDVWPETIARARG